MSNSISCPNCSTSLKLPDSAAGKNVKCPKCGERFQAPPAAEVAKTSSSPSPKAAVATPVVAQPVQAPEPAAPSSALDELAAASAPSPSGNTNVVVNVAQSHSSRSGGGGGLRCPKCGSTHTTANKKGFRAGKACLGWCLGFGLFSTLCGFCGANKVLITCLSCGKQWKPGRA